MRSLSLLVFAGLVALAGCGKTSYAQAVPGDGGMHIADALKRDPITRDAATLHLDAGAAK